MIPEASHICTFIKQIETTYEANQIVEQMTVSNHQKELYPKGSLHQSAYT